jgi:hypothetical protein
VYEEFAGADLADKRLDRRLLLTAGFLANSPMAPINQACPDWASTKAAYRLFDNANASPKAIREPHIENTVKRMVTAAADGTLLVVQDTAFIAYTGHRNVQGIGPIGNDNEGRGLIMHSALVFTASGVPLGLVSQNIWSRKEVPDEGRVEKILRLQGTAIEDKESFKWLIGMRETRERVPPGVKIVTVGDREADFFELHTEAQELKLPYLVRARVDRLLVPEESDCHKQMSDALAAAKDLGTMEVSILGNSKRKTRTATVTVKTAQVAIKPPQRRGHAKNSGSDEPTTVKLIAATELNPSEGDEAISWVLVTNLPVPDMDAAVEKVRWYSRRFGIETFHKTLKSGCQVEKCCLERGERLARYLALYSVIAVRMMHVAYLAREQPELPATEVFSQAELDALHVLSGDGQAPNKPPSLKEAVRKLGRLGGHLGRKRDGDPGMTVMWRGWMQLYTAVRVMDQLRQTGRINSS